MSAKPSWRKLLERLESLTADNGVNAWATAKGATELWSREDFQSGSGGREQAEAKLQKLASRFALGLHEMMIMFEFHPDRKDWEDGRLDLLKEDSLSKQMSRSRVTLATAGSRGDAVGSVGKNGEKKKPHARYAAVSRAEYEKVKERLAAAKREIRRLRKRIHELEAQCGAVA